MPALAAAIITALGFAMKSLVAKVLLALGLQMAFFVGMDALITFIIDQAMNNLSGLDPTIYTIVKLARVPDAIAVLSAAAMVKHTLTWGAGKLAFVGRMA